jgi:glutamyl-tRNA synthetase
VIRGRFAPSPTGDLHLGNARTALLAWLQARAAGGRFVLRVEDLDFGRVRPGVLEAQLQELRWLGIDWDEGPDVGGPHAPYVQSLRQDLYQSALERLAGSGLLFECFCSRKEILAAASAPHEEESEGPAYPGTCRTVDSAELRRRRHGPGALRFITPPEEVRFVDLLQGLMTFYPARAVGDFVVRRKDGVAAYQLAVVVDDAAMEVTHVVRGADLLSSTARQILLYRALGLAAPAWVHVPLLLDERGQRLAKRNAATSLGELRARAVSPALIVGWLAASAGLIPAGEQATARDLVPLFDLSRLRRAPTAATTLPWAGETA